MNTDLERYVVISDLHGRAGLLEACYERYGDDVTYVSNGDAVDAPEHGDVKATIQILQDIGAVCVYGNHEWVLSAVMYDPDDDSRRVWAETWAGYERGVIRSYGLKSRGFMLPSVIAKHGKYDYFAAATELKEAVNDAGHDTFFENLLPYYETDKFISVHGGLIEDDLVWDGECGKKQFLDTVASSPKLAERQWNSEPQMIFDSEYERAELRVVPSFVGKVLITGHNHNSEHSITRVSDNGKRVRLAGHVANGIPLYVYESWTGGVVAISEPTLRYV